MRPFVKILQPLVHSKAQKHGLRLTLAIRVPLTASITPGENCNVTPGSTVSAARAPMIRFSRMIHGLLKASILKDCRRKPPFDMRLHAACALQLVAMATTASVMVTTEHIQFMLTFCHNGEYSLHSLNIRQSFQLSFSFLDRNNTHNSQCKVDPAI